MKAPSGTVTASTAPAKIRIWIQPLAVKATLLELLGLQERVPEIGEQQHGEQKPDQVFEAHGRASDPLAGPNVEPGEQEEEGDEPHVDEVLHALSSGAALTASPGTRR